MAANRTINDVSIPANYSVEDVVLTEAQRRGGGTRNLKSGKPDVRRLAGGGTRNRKRGGSRDRVRSKREGRGAPSRTSEKFTLTELSVNGQAIPVTDTPAPPDGTLLD